MRAAGTRELHLRATTIRLSLGSRVKSSRGGTEAGSRGGKEMKRESGQMQDGAVLSLHKSAWAEKQTWQTVVTSARQSLHVMRDKGKGRKKRLAPPPEMHLRL